MKKKTYLIAAVILIVSFSASFFQLLYTPDRFLMDKLYLTLSDTDNRIRIIAIDEKTLNAYGSFNTWSREKSAELVTKLNASEQNRPSVIGFDIMFIGSTDEQTDASLAEACKASGNVVTAVNIVNETVLESHSGNRLKEDPLHISLVEKPYDALANSSDIGFANTIADNDSYIRRSILYRTYQEETINSFSYAVYKSYCQKNGLNAYVPDLGAYNEFSFCYSGKPGTYETVSLVDVLDGTVDARTFKDCIVLVGAYAPGMQDAFNTPVNRSEQMYGVEIHANIIEAFLEEKTYNPLSSVWSALATGLLASFYYLVLKNGQNLHTNQSTDTSIHTSNTLFTKFKIVSGAFIGIALIAAELLTGRLLFQNGMELPLLTLPVFLILIYAFELISGYIEERMKRRQIVSAFKKYVAPQIVDELSQKEQFEIALGGETRDIAVLFVDIRGFTPLSESLEPEQVVKILNEYLALTTDAIFRNSGTLDKFIGDAAMAIFNAPFDLEDYVYKAVCAARDIAAGSSELQNRLTKQFGKSISFGIGVHCGPAIVGNIGCDVRMDYTAIGDTVNTSARLESNAKGGQILISDTVVKRLESRIAVTEIGTIPLKGKRNEVMVYQLDQILP